MPVPPRDARKRIEALSTVFRLKMIMAKDETCPFRKRTQGLLQSSVVALIRQQPQQGKGLARTLPN